MPPTKKAKGNSGGHYCTAINCNNNQKKNAELSFFRLPKDPDRFVLFHSFQIYTIMCYIADCVIFSFVLHIVKLVVFLYHVLPNVM